ncbi:MAG: hypothetical protein RLZZ301_1553 [Bacteroidota bacterium]|jgi:hypothetical protein
MANWSNSQIKQFLLLGFLGLASLSGTQKTASTWGFAGHRRINEYACYLLPPSMSVFFRENQRFLIEHAVDPDQRRYSVPEEAARHFIDLDRYYQKGEDPFWQLPQSWTEALACYPEDTLMAHGIVPWHIVKMKYRLQEAFERHDISAILKNAAELGHYIADAHVPLHTTRNYNGQLSNQRGIHGLWESRLVELEAEHYNYWIGHATYISDVSAACWKAIADSHAALDSVFLIEKVVSQQFTSAEKYSFEQRGTTLVQVYAQEFCQVYHQALNGMVERRMRAAILMTASIWYTAWIDAGQPDLSSLRTMAPVSTTTDSNQIVKFQLEKALGRICD